MLNFKPESTLQATRLERGDKYDQSVVYLLSTLPSEAFLVEKKGEAWEVTTGVVSVSQGDPVLYPEHVVVGETVAKPKDEKPKEKPKKKNQGLIENEK